MSTSTCSPLTQSSASSFCSSDSEAVPQSTMVAGCLYLMLPDEVPVASSFLTLSLDFSLRTSPKTTCLPSSQDVGTVVTKNCEPLLSAD